MMSRVVVHGATRATTKDELISYASCLAQSAEQPGITDELRDARLWAAKAYADEALTTAARAKRTGASNGQA